MPRSTQWCRDRSGRIAPASARRQRGGIAAKAGLSSCGGAETVTAVVADRAAIIRVGLVSVLGGTTDMKVVASVADGEEAFRCIRRHRPELAVIEPRLPKIDAVGIATSVREAGLATRVVVLAGRCRGGEVTRALSAGVSAYLTRAESTAFLQDALRRVLGGETILSVAAQNALTRHLRQGGRGEHDHGSLAPMLTGRELQVLQCAARGLSMVETARELNVSAATVRNHRESIFAKLAVRNSPAAVCQAFRLGLLA